MATTPDTGCTQEIAAAIPGCRCSFCHGLIRSARDRRRIQSLLCDSILSSSLWFIGVRNPGDIASCYADPSLARQLMGWQAEQDLEAMCRDSWNWRKKNPDGYNS